MGFDPEKIGVITPYKLQAREIVKRLKDVVREERAFLDARFPNKSAERTVKDPSDYLADELGRIDLSIDSKGERGENDEIDTGYKIAWTEFKRDWICKIDTVDAFQGNEREIIIISTVRTGPTRNLTFLNDARRFNVAVSRAKWLSIVVGHWNTIRGGNYWPEVYRIAEKNALTIRQRGQTTSKGPRSNL
ncbi:IGHMBP2 family helicase, partial [Olea europaea subsp. europaea]